MCSKGRCISDVGCRNSDLRTWKCDYGSSGADVSWRRLRSGDGLRWRRGGYTVTDRQARLLDRRTAAWRTRTRLLPEWSEECRDRLRVDEMRVRAEEPQAPLGPLTLAIDGNAVVAAERADPHSANKALAGT
jgi:hypothetical protein